MSCSVNYKVIKLLTNIVETTMLQPVARHITYDIWNKQNLPLADVPYITDDLFPELVDSKKDKRILAVKQLLHADRCTNAIMYQPLSMMPWHTNSNYPGTRTYYTFSKGNSVFRYLKDGCVVDKQECPGWNINIFDVSASEPLWHTIWTEHERYAFGFIKLKESL